jgi:hypothetical protein
MLAIACNLGNFILFLNHASAKMDTLKPVTPNAVNAWTHVSHANLLNTPV